MVHRTVINYHVLKFVKALYTFVLKTSQYIKKKNQRLLIYLPTLIQVENMMLSIN